MVLTEFGGIAYAPPEDRDDSWGYSEVETPEDLAEAYAKLLETVRHIPLLSGFCYTQFADTYQERNGLLYADRTPKFSIELIAEVTTGSEFQRFEAMRLQRKASRMAGKKTTMTASGGVSDRG